MIETERLTLRPLTLDDAPVLQELLNDPEIAKEIPALTYPLPPGGAEEWIRGAMEDTTFAILGREGPTRDKIVGVIGIHREPGNQGSIGGWVAKDWRHNRIAVEALHAAVRYGYESMGLTTVYMLRKGKLWVAPKGDYAEHHIPFKRNRTAWRILNQTGDGPRDGALRRAGRGLARLFGRS